MKTSDSPIKLFYAYNTDPKRLWACLTERDAMVAWFFDNIPEFEAREGFSTQFPVYSGDRLFTHCWEVQEVRIEEYIRYSWSYLEYGGMASVAYRIVQQEGGCKLVFKMFIEEDFDGGIEEFKLESCIAGWNYFLRQSLKDYLEKA